jgi:MFS transporter, UMF1 family
VTLVTPSQNSPSQNSPSRDPDPRPRPAGPLGVFAWCAYDWANSGFPTVIMTFVFSAYFTQAVAASPTEGTAQWGTALSISGILIALISPVFGAIADNTGRRKPWTAVFSLVCVAGTALLWYTEPDPSYALYGLVVLSVANLGFEVGTVFYNAMLPDLVRPERLGRISGWAWGLGYAGGLVCLVLCLLLFVQPEQPALGLDKAAAEHVRIVGPFVAIWFLVFSLPFFLLTPDRPPTGLSAGAAVRMGLRQLSHTLANLRAHRNIARFIVARLFYTDGLNTLFAFGGIYAAGTFGMTQSDIILFGITLNVTAGLGAFAFGWLDDRIGSKRTVMISLVAMMALAVPILLVESEGLFWGLALALGLFMGPVQSASRTLMARLAPPELQTEMFGLFALSGKITAFLGPALVGWATFAFDSQRVGMSAVLLLLALGAAIMWGVRDARPA